MVITVVRKQPRIDHVTVFVVVFLTVVVIGDALCIDCHYYNHIGCFAHYRESLLI